MWSRLLKITVCFLVVQYAAFAADITKLDGEWYSYKWKYGYTLKNGKGITTIANSPSFKVGQEIVRLTAVGSNSFVGENIYKDGVFYKVKASLQPNGKLLFEGEKNIKWEMDRILPETLQSLLATNNSNNVPSGLPVEVSSFIGRRDICEHFLGEDPYDEDRRAFLEWSVCKNCMGTDNELVRLKNKYRGDQNVLSRLSGYSGPVEPSDRSSWVDACSKAKKPKSYR